MNNSLFVHNLNSCEDLVEVALYFFKGENLFKANLLAHQFKQIHLAELGDKVHTSIFINDGPFDLENVFNSLELHQHFHFMIEYLLHIIILIPPLKIINKLQIFLSGSS